MFLQGRDGKVVQVYRKRWVIHIERLTREKVNGMQLLNLVTITAPIDTSMLLSVMTAAQHVHVLDRRTLLSITSADMDGMIQLA